MSIRAAASFFLCRFRQTATAVLITVAFAALTGCNLNPGQSGPHVENAVVTPVAPPPAPPPSAPATPPTNGQPAPTGQAAPTQPKRTFGLDIHDPINHWPTVPFDFWRLWDATVDWARVEPARGQYDFSRFDKYVELAQQHHVQIVYVMGNTPAWAAVNPTSASNEGIPGASSGLTNIQDWQDFVTTVVTRYKGKIQAYEIWNEANLTGYWTGGTDQMLQMVQIAFNTIKQIDPDAMVLSPSITAESGEKWLANFLSVGGANYGDAIAYHLYSRVSAPENLVSYYQDVMLLGRQWGKDVWDTEVGWGPWGTFDDTQSASFLARTFILQSAVGYTHIGWYAWDDRGAWVHIYLVQPDMQTPTLAGVAFGEIQSWLRDASVSCTSQSGTWQCDTAADDGTHKYIVWNASTPQTFAIPAGWQVTKMRDLTGATTLLTGPIQIDSMPVLLEP